MAPVWAAWAVNVSTSVLWTTVLSTIGLMTLGALEARSAFQPVNAISHMLFGDGPIVSKGPVPRFFVSGFLLNVAALAAWALVAEGLYRLLGDRPGEPFQATVVSVAVTLLAMVVDFHVVPKRLTPGFERVLSRRSLTTVYVLLACGFFLAGLQRV